MRINTRIKKIVLAILVVTLSAGPTGCWSLKEINSLSVVTVIGFDKVPGTDETEVSVLVVTKGRDGGAAAGISSVTQWTASGRGRSIGEAMNSLLAKTKRRIYYAHISSVVIGEEYARQGLGEMIDMTARSIELRGTAFMMVCRGTARSALTTISQSKGGSEYGQGKLASTQRIAYTINYGEFVKSINNRLTTTATLLELVEVVEGESGRNQPEGGGGEKKGMESTNKEVRVTGVAAFKGDKLAGFLNETESYGLLWLEGKSRQGYINTPGINDQRKRITYKIREADREITPVFADGRLKALVRVKAACDIIACEDPVDTTDPAVIGQLSRQFELAVAEQCRQAVQKAQSLGTDIFGFGEEAYRRYPREWSEIQDHWDEEFTSLPVEIFVEGRIRNAGLTSSRVYSESFPR